MDFFLQSCNFLRGTSIFVESRMYDKHLRTNFSLQDVAFRHCRQIATRSTLCAASGEGDVPDHIRLWGVILGALSLTAWNNQCLVERLLVRTASMRDNNLRTVQGLVWSEYEKAPDIE